MTTIKVGVQLHPQRSTYDEYAEAVHIKCGFTV
jgi:hypothetical protein